VKTVTETEPVGWVSAGNPTCTITVPGTNTSSIGTLTPTSAIATLGAGDTVRCNFVNDLLPRLTIVKQVTGGGGTPFTYDVTGGGSGLNGTVLTPAANSSASTPVTFINPGPSTVNEHHPLATGWTLTGSSCVGATGGAVGSNPETGNPLAFFTYAFSAAFGDNIVCSYTNSVVILTTRTQGFWATHTALADNVWNGGPLPPGFPAGGAVVGSPDEFLCGFKITAVADDEVSGGVAPSRRMG
jgi:hypothetical protein